MRHRVCLRTTEYLSCLFFFFYFVHVRGVQTKKKMWFESDITKYLADPVTPLHARTPFSVLLMDEEEEKEEDKVVVDAEVSWDRLCLIFAGVTALALFVVIVVFVIMKMTSA